METIDHYETKKYLAFLSGGHFEVLGPFNKYYDASSYSRCIYFEYERHKNRYKYAAEKLYEIIQRGAIGILIVQDHEKEEAIRTIGNDFPGVKIYCKSEIKELYPGLLPTILENVGRRQKEFRIKRRLILKLDMLPREKATALAQNFRQRINSILFGNR